MAFKMQLVLSGKSVDVVSEGNIYVFIWDGKPLRFRVKNIPEKITVEICGVKVDCVSNRYRVRSVFYNGIKSSNATWKDLIASFESQIQHKAT